jgi:hypothetical protein
VDDASSLKRRADLTPEEAEYGKRYREIGDRLMSIGSERGELLSKKTLTPEQTERLAQLEKDLAAGYHAFESFLGDLTRHFSAKPEMTRRIDALRETQGIMEDLRELPPGTVAIFTLIGDDKFHAILRTSDAQKAYEYPIRAADLNRKIVAFAATPITPDSHTIILDHFNGSTAGTAYGNPSYISGPSGLGEAVNLTAGTFLQYPVPSSLETAGTIEMWVNPHQYNTGIMDFNWNNTTSFPPAGHVLEFCRLRSRCVP